MSKRKREDIRPLDAAFLEEFSSGQPLGKPDVPFVEPEPEVVYKEPTCGCC
jgi:hypothetical protein